MGETTRTIQTTTLQPVKPDQRFLFHCSLSPCFFVFCFHWQVAFNQFFCYILILRLRLIYWQVASIAAMYTASSSGRYLGQVNSEIFTLARELTDTLQQAGHADVFADVAADGCFFKLSTRSAKDSKFYTEGAVMALIGGAPGALPALARCQARHPQIITSHPFFFGASKDQSQRDILMALRRFTYMAKSPIATFYTFFTFFNANANKGSPRFDLRFMVVCFRGVGCATWCLRWRQV